MSPANLSVRLCVVALVSRYLTNKLIQNRLLPECLAALSTASCDAVVSSGITCPFGQLSLAPGYISDSLLTRPPLVARVAPALPIDLHVLGTPPAFNLSQDQTLHLKSFDLLGE